MAAPLSSKSKQETVQLLFTKNGNDWELTQMWAGNKETLTAEQRKLMRLVADSFLHLGHAPK